jgi:hypothetical protein
MCLSQVDETYDTPSSLIVDGWKQFGGTEAKPQVRMPVNGKLVLPLDTWIQATAESTNGLAIKADDGNKYAPGFHAYVDEQKVGSYRRVFLRKISCMGLEDRSKKTVIAQEMFIPSKKNGWPPLTSEVVERARNVPAAEA